MLMTITGKAFAVEMKCPAKARYREACRSSDAAAVVRTYDLVVAMTGGGPGLSSQFPTVYVYEYMFTNNLAQGLAASSVLLCLVAIFVVPWAFYEFARKKTTG